MLEIILTKTDVVRQFLVNLSNIRIIYAVLSSRMPTNSQGCDGLELIVGSVVTSKCVVQRPPNSKRPVTQNPNIENLV